MKTLLRSVLQALVSFGGKGELSLSIRGPAMVVALALAICLIALVGHVMAK